MALVRDQEGVTCGLWVCEAEGADDRDLLSLLSMSVNLPEELRVAILAGKYRVVPNEHDDAGGCFVMFGDAVAPGERSPERPARRTTPCPNCGHRIDVSTNRATLDGVLDSAQQAYLQTIGSGDNPHVRCPKCGTTFLQFGG